MSELTKLLTQAKQTPTMRPDFYKALWDAELYFIGRMDETDDTYHLSFYEAAGRTLLPCFSSEGLFRSVVPEAEHETVVLLPVREVFPSVGSEITVVLNPFTDVGKEFDALERRALQAGVLFELPPKAAAAQEPGENTNEPATYFGTPKEKPEALLAALEDFFPTRPEIQTAYLGMIAITDSTHPPHPLLGLVWTGPSEAKFLELTLDIQSQIRASLPDAPQLDVYRLTPDDTREVARYLLDKTTPIYTKEP
ncbi:enhanced serine sensitivity protein SseB C-terminal domain-containing protein [Tumebacillus flagellatus]|uniref:SseB protein N-terminal domain-containing protein n=1 Tax=Tumebacillus flagellatus TaxID=1157490 RepID=A0A074M6T0_9BACL|nr:enhanced serine sensitivity protein SseB C-terminal domain-containing protein [Tumebacillus flagellatus]KEO81707.1 hypothetical protein EL26_19010 [Tumebacillus flagellatus]